MGYTAGFCAPGNQPEIERERDTGTKALMEQRWFTQHGVGIYTVTRSLSKRELQTITFYCIPKKEEGTYHRNEKCLDSSAQSHASPLNS